MPQHHLQTLIRFSSYIALLTFVYGLTGGALVHFAPHLTAVYAVGFAFLASVSLTGGIAWAWQNSNRVLDAATQTETGGTV